MLLLLELLLPRNITNPIKDIINKLNSFSRGDFTVKFYSNRKDETQKLTNALNNSIVMLSNMILETKRGCRKIS